MHGEGCWSTVVCRPTERAALGLSGDSDWLLQCRLPIGHRGNHATDASTHPRHDRRLWLEWNDFDNRAQSLIERNPCPVPSADGAGGCVYFAGHGGAHFFAPSNGHAPSVMTGAGNRRSPASASPTPPGVAAPTPPPAEPAGPPRPRAGSHRLPDSHQPAPPDVPAAERWPNPAGAEPQSTYRGGRRSTGAEAPVAQDRHGRRHRPDAAGAEPAPLAEGPGRHGGGHAAPEPAESVVPPQHAAPEPPPVVASRVEAPVGSAPVASGVPALENAGEAATPAPASTDGVLFDPARRAAVSEALDEVAAALAKLAAALRD